MTAPESHPIPHMTSAEFRCAGHTMIDWIADYLDTVESRRVFPDMQPGDLFSALPDAAPSTGEPWDTIAADIDRLILPAITHWQSPNFLAYFPCNSSPPAILGELLSAGLGINGFLWQCSPAITELEMRMMDWLGAAIGLPDSFLFGPDYSLAVNADARAGGGVIHGSASEAVLTAMIAARERARAQGHDESKLIAYTSTQSHSSVVKAAMVSGITSARIRLIPVDHHLRMSPDALAAQLEADRAQGLIPFFLCATLGTTSTGAFDPIHTLAPILHRAAPNAWIHVDAAYAGAACICPEFRSMLQGIEFADSFNFNPHKWLLTNFDCSAFWVRDRRSMIAALSITPAYLRNKASSTGSVIDYRDWQIPLGRRFRALKLWFVMRSYGIEGLRAYIREQVRLGALFESLVRADDRFELPLPRCLSLITFRLKGPDEATRTLIESINADGMLHLTPTTVPITRPGNPPQPPTDQFLIRCGIGTTRTEERHIRAAWQQIQAKV